MAIKPKKAIKPNRPSWDEYFLEIAKVVAQRSTCDRANVGAVIARNKVILSTGYNGAPRGLPHCDDVGHEIVDGHCVRTIHAEANAIAQAARNGAAIEGATIYLTISPCYDCFKMMINGGIKEVIYKEFYMSRYGLSKAVLDLSKKTGVKITAYKK
ncbi:MAG: deaminase [Candidatus Yanofskybacteria bacterium RIFCSPLOWO2_02_FULL_43_10]|uniref:Deaminase n=1 Tax=Candidatus Yanofskybacteria bacterium RIFCSPLOWO2_12_FULL_43_11b TaxID=1802710 RepID=A0A1F8H710_9BACT|nr:MAG: deaminase [Candidatus Yanofskybacteria bacterium RIFCSPHIGHO2_01_FULL_43_32]OGN11558.1 MAG: deaminase [Candidatus Yanofskybacteria bacterium RIFCSPHIGHO2_02_FULL_43_12]OGN17400.1 MAG: deaminase [Candidatus Yanofskybacteria bacterium RIFCSPHIGHO2_12_FULL_43_11]OGN24895.1 MAG: deaminase [Candidatus Yanofskybacteria bacterium RIFCSPLOWO2_01_FULL_43_46]OGN30255.1 MAG: deaminase [Candidatus Yanofskybacteria bacterium RIFCSPLOWO2_02_FULL_43_10]OGN33375.1 MAG: deaminase [Candidatus Yanofskyba